MKQGKFGKLTGVYCGWMAAAVAVFAGAVPSAWAQSPAAGGVVAVAPIAGVNVREEHVIPSEHLLQDYLMEEGKFSIKGIERPAEGELGDADLVAKAKELGAGFLLKAALLRLGERVKAQVTLIRLDDGTVAFQDGLTAKSPEDLDDVWKRLARALATGKKSVDNADIYSVTEKEQQELKKVQATNNFGVRLNEKVFLNRPERVAAAALSGLGVFWLYDVRTLLLEVSFDFAAGKDQHHSGVSLGAYYPFSTATFSPYVGGGVQYGTTAFPYSTGPDYTSPDAMGMSLYGAGGVIFGRTASVNMRAELRLFQDLYTAGGVMANGVGFMVGLGL